MACIRRLRNTFGLNVVKKNFRSRFYGLATVNKVLFYKNKFRPSIHQLVATYIPHIKCKITRCASSSMQFCEELFYSSMQKLLCIWFLQLLRKLWIKLYLSSSDIFFAFARKKITYLLDSIVKVNTIHSHFTTKV